ncbi:hypothetical protein [Methanoregula sp.]|uniref:hypothetical protein n=1 Tax=Methanoregula sp. TaxID=2052170 RepID=UPI003C78C784
MYKTGKRDVFFGIVLVTLLCLATIPAVSAFTATLVSPADTNTALHNGNTISIQISGLAVNDQFSYRITSTDLNTAGNSVSLNSVNMPFGFANGLASTSLATTGITGPATLTVTRDSDHSQLLLTGPSPITSASNIKKDTYDVSISGTKSGSTIGIDYQVSGPVSDAGTNPSTLSFTVPEVTSGHLAVQVMDGPNTVLSETFTIAAPPGPTPTPAPTQAPSYSGGGGGGTGGATGGLLAPQGGQSLLAPPGISATSVTIQHDTGGKVLNDYSVQTDPAAGFSSSVDITTGTTVLTSAGQPVDTVSVTPLDPTAVPAAAATQGGVFSFSGLSVECEPSGAQFTGGSATISFSLTPQQWADALTKVNGDTAAMTIQFYDTSAKTWIGIPTTVDPVTHAVTAHVTHFSTYALFYTITSESASASPQVTASQNTPSAPAGSSVTPASVVTPVNTLNAPPVPTRSPGLPGFVVIAVVGFVGYCVSRKKQ